MSINLDERNELYQAVARPLGAMDFNGAEISKILEAKRKLTDEERETFGGVINRYKSSQVTKRLSRTCDKDDLAAMKDDAKLKARISILKEVDHAFSEACIEITDVFHNKCSEDLRDTIAARGRNIAAWKGEDTMIEDDLAGIQALPVAQYMLLGYMDLYREQAPEVHSRLMTALYERQSGDRAPEAVESIMKQYSSTLKQEYNVSAIRARWRESQMYVSNKVACGLDDIKETSALVKKLNDIWLGEKESSGDGIHVKKVEAKPETASARKEKRGPKIQVCSICLEHAMRVGMDPTTSKDVPLPKPAAHTCEFPALSIGFVAAITRKAATPA